MPYTVEFENGKKAEFQTYPTGEDIDFVAKQIGITQKKPAAPTQQPSFLKRAGGALISSEKRFGESIAGAISPLTPSGRRFKSAQAQTQKANDEYITTVSRRLKQKKAQGLDTSKEIEQLRNSGAFQGQDSFEFNPALKKTTRQVLGEALGVAVDVASFGALPGIAKKAVLKPTLLKSVATGAKFGAGFGAGQGFAQGLQENNDTETAIGRGVYGGVIGGITGGALAGAGNLAGKAVSRFSRKSQTKLPSVAGELQEKGRKDLSQTVTEKIMPKLTAREKRLALSEGRIIRGRSSRVFGTKADTVLPDAQTQKSVNTLLKRIRGVEKLDDVQIADVAQKEITSISNQLKPQMRAVSVTPDVTQKATDTWRKVKTTQASQIDFEDFGGTKLQKQFERFLDEAVSGADPKTGKFRPRNLDDVWEIAKQYDDIIPDRVKQATELSDSRLQYQKDIWLENRKVLRDLLKDSATKLGKEAREAFSDMTDLYRARNSVIQKGQVTTQGKPGLFRPRNLIGGAAGVVGIPILGRLFSGDGG